jgi:hypothetical protein
MTDYYKKYLKFKNKYLQLKGGFYCPQEAIEGKNHKANLEEVTECQVCFSNIVNLKFKCCHCICNTCLDVIFLRGDSTSCPFCRNIEFLDMVWRLENNMWIRHEIVRPVPELPDMNEQRFDNLPPGEQAPAGRRRAMIRDE